MSVPRGIRCKTPGNVRRSPDHWQGEVLGSDPDFVTFDTMAHGVRCTGKLLLTYQQQHGLRTIADLITRWAPPVEHETAAYIRAVAAACGVAATARISLGEGMLSRLCKAIFHHENGGDFVSDADLSAGVAMALGLTPSTAIPGHDALVAAARDAGATP